MDNRTEFMREQQRAIERMREMSRKVGEGAPHTMPPSPPFVRINGRQEPAAQSMHENADYAGNAEYAINNATTAKQQTASSSQNTHGSSGSTAQGSSLLGIDLPILDRIKSEPDMTLILGILLILWSEKADKKLLLALLYILF